MIYKGKEAVIKGFAGREYRFFIYPEGCEGHSIYLSNSGEWGNLPYDDGWWNTREEAEAFLMRDCVPITPEYDEYDQSED